MLDIIFKNHPSLIHGDTISDICRPLNYLNIDYFSHAFVNKMGEFAALPSSAKLMTNYIEKGYYKDDVHVEGKVQNILGKHVLWDALTCRGNTAKMLKDAAEMDIKHFFTIIQEKEDGTHYYHFANNASNDSINHFYINHIDLLESFIQYFDDQVSSFKELKSAFDIKIPIIDNESTFKINVDKELIDIDKNILQFKNDINWNDDHNKHNLFHKDTKIAISLSAQQLKCLELLVQGNTAKQIAEKMNLSTRTVEHYLERVRKITGCRNVKELFTRYYQSQSS